MILTMIFSCFNIVYAENNIQCTASVNDNYVNIEGQLTGADKAYNVTLLVGDIDNIIYVDQVVSKDDGSFTFNFRIADSVPTGEYPLKIGSDSNCAPYNGVLKYTKPISTEEVKFVEANVDIVIKNYVPQITGTVICENGKEIELNTENVTDNNVLENKVITSDKAYSLSYTLPSLLKARDYAFSAVCKEGDNVLANMSIDISSSTILISLNGEAHTADNVNFTAELKSNNTGLVDKKTTFTGDKSITTNLPNILANMSYHLSAVGYETVIKPEPGPEPSGDITAAVYDFSGEAEEEFILSVSALNIASFEGKKFKLMYDSEQIEVIDMSAQSFNTVLDVGQIGNIEIISYQPGCIEFCVNGVSIGTQQIWSGVLNLFKIRFSNTFEGTTRVTLEAQ